MNDVIQRFRLALKFSMIPAELLLRWTLRLLDKIQSETGNAIDFIGKTDLKKLDPKHLRHVSKALFAFYLTTQGLDEVQLRAAIQLLESEIRKAVPFLKVSADPNI